jgi:3-hydroxy-3-methylglutaryl CoA synthase
MSTSSVGISALGVHFPSAALPLAELGALRGVDPNKYLSGLGCHEMALCPAGTDVVALAVTAARRALESWQGSLSDIGMIVVGTETAKDMSRPLSAWVAEELGLTGAVRSYEVKHACYGGTLALRQAVEWRRSGAARGKSALVIAADVALYAPEDGGEPTQGAGAVAMIVGTPDIAEVELHSFPYSQPAFDFWRPVGQAFPSVEGQLSLDCYKLAAESCFADYVAFQQSEGGAAGESPTRHPERAARGVLPRALPQDGEEGRGRRGRAPGPGRGRDVCVLRRQGGAHHARERPRGELLHGQPVGLGGQHARRAAQGHAHRRVLVRQRLRRRAA